MSKLYPITIISDRYSGTYSGGEYTAWWCYPEDVPSEASSDDITCATFWDSERFDSTVRFVGRGSTPNEALENLEYRITKHTSKRSFEFMGVNYKGWED